MYVLSWPGLLALLIQFVLPLLVGLVTKASWPGGPKAVLLLALTAVTQFVTAASLGGAFDWKVALYSTAVGFVISVAAHFGLWKPTGVAYVAQDVGVAD